MSFFTKRFTFGLFLLFCIKIVYAQPTKSSLKEMPYFEGCAAFLPHSLEKRACSNQHLMRYIVKSLSYPDSARAASIEGKVYASFEVDTIGWVKNCVILHDIGGGCGAEARRMIETMPRWEVATENNKPQQVQLFLPIVFELEDSVKQKNYHIVWGNAQDTISGSALKNLANNPVEVRDKLGNTISTTNLSFYFEKKGKKTLKATSAGTMNKAITKLLNQIKSEGILSIESEILLEGKPLMINRKYQILVQSNEK